MGQGDRATRCFGQGAAIELQAVRVYADSVGIGLARLQGVAKHQGVAGVA